MSIPNIQVAFQGGGAKLVPMLPIAHAFMEAQESGYIKVKAVAGTSAGSICAALIATVADFDKVREKILSEGHPLISSLVPLTTQIAISDFQDEKKWKWITAITHHDLLLDILLRGKPLFDNRSLNKFLQDVIMAGTGKTHHKIDNLRSKLSIIVSDIALSSGKNISSGDLITAISDSCSLPIALRSFQAASANHNVDGGLCDNLPVEHLLSDIDSPVFAVYPSTNRDETPINNIVLYLSRLFSTSINHNVRRSVSLISEPFRFEAISNIEFLDFKAALMLLENTDWYEREKSTAYKRIVNFSRSFGVTRSPNQARVLDAAKIGEFEDALINITRSAIDQLNIVKTRMTVRINCDSQFRSLKEAEDRSPDTVTRTTVISAPKSGLKFYRANQMIEQDSIIPTIWSARNLTAGTEIPIRVLPLGKRSLGARHCLIEFLNSEKNISGGDLVEVESVYLAPPAADLRLINMGRSEYMGYGNSQPKPIGEAELVVIYPARLGILTINLHQGKNTCEASSVSQIIFPETEKKLLGDEWNVAGIRAIRMRHGSRFYAQINVLAMKN